MWNSLDRFDALQAQLQTKADVQKIEEFQSLLQQTVAPIIQCLESLHAQLQTKADVQKIEEFQALLQQTTTPIIQKIEEFQSLLQQTTTPLKNDLKEMGSQVQDHKWNILNQQRRLTLLLEEMRKRLPETLSHDQLQNMVKEQDHVLDAWYVTFEDRMRGTRKDIKQRQAIYLPYVKEISTGTPDMPIVDLGCGRGEWLELLREHGLVAKGVDVNTVMVQQCQELGLDVIESDVIAFLQKQKSDGLLALSAFHIIEHISFPSLIQLLDESLRVLRPGGILILETPNPRNILVGTGDFYRDPTHSHPIFPDTLEFLGESRGFIKAACYFMTNSAQQAVLTPIQKTRFDSLEDYLTVSRDFAFLGYKA